MDRLNLTSVEARRRVGVYVQDRYKHVCSGIGLITSRRVTNEVVLDPADPESLLPEVVVSNMEKVLKITLQYPNERIRILRELTYDEVTNMATVRSLPRAYAVKRMGAGEVIIVLSSYPEDPFTLLVEGYDRAEVLTDFVEPFLPSDFHDILVHGAMSDELRKMEKPQLASIAETKFEQRFSDLRMFIAKSSYLDVFQGKDRYGDNWWSRSWWSGGY